MPAPGDLIHQQSKTTGALALALTAVNGKRTFDAEFGTGGTDKFDYFISNRDAAEWERGTGHLVDAGTLVRDTVLASSNGNSAVTFSAGTKDIVNDVPANKQVTTDTQQTLLSKTLASPIVTGLLDATGGQIKFPAAQIPSADPNTLDDYEEGTWTPTVFGGTTAGTSTQTTQLGRYVKIGSIVAFYFRVVFNSHTGTGQARISGLPFTATATSPCAVRFSSTSFTGNPQSLVVSGTTLIYFENVTSGSPAAALALGTSGDFNMAGTYFA